MERKSFQKATAYVLIVILFAFASSVVNAIFASGMKKMDTLIEWEKQYPFTKQIKKSEEGGTTLQNYARMIEYLKSRIVKYSKEIFHYEKFIELAVTAEKIFELPNMDDHTILSDGYILPPASGKIDVTQQAGSLKAFNNFLTNRNISLLYVQLPGKICREEDKAMFRHDMTNENADNLLLELKQSNIPYLDLREEIHKQGLVHHDLFLKTDHHWKPEAGLWASGVIAEHLNSTFDFDIDISLYNPERYDYQVYNDYLGSSGRRITLSAAQLESFSFIFPKFETDLTVKIPSRDINRRGDFHVMYNQEYWDYIQQKDIYNRNYYEVYSYSDNPIMLVHNNRLEHNKKKILMIRDSFSCVLTPFLALGIRDVEVMDIRTSFFSGSVQSFINEELPDVVLVLYSPGIIPDEKCFDFR